MGISSTAELIYGYLVGAYDDEGEPTEFWDDEEADWKQFPAETGLEIVPFGHYEDGPNGAILTHSSIPKKLACTSDPIRVPHLLYTIDTRELWDAYLSFDDTPSWYVTVSAG